MMQAASRIFIGSSTESLEAARAVQAKLSQRYAVTVWDTAFLAGKVLIDGILESLKTNDFGVFLFGPDDRIVYRGKIEVLARPNVIFELGAFMGGLGRERSLFAWVNPSRRKMNRHNIADLAGILRLSDIRKDGRNWDASATAKDIARVVDELGPALRSSYDEVADLRASLDDRLLKGTKTSYWLGDLVASSARKRGKRWTKNSYPSELLDFLRPGLTAKIVDDAYWWLVVLGVFRFSSIEAFTDDKSWSWNHSLPYVEFSERGVALLNQYRSPNAAPKKRPSKKRIRKQTRR